MGRLLLKAGRGAGSGASSRVNTGCVHLSGPPFWGRSSHPLMVVDMCSPLALSPSRPRSLPLSSGDQGEVRRGSRLECTGVGVGSQTDDRNSLDFVWFSQVTMWFGLTSTMTSSPGPLGTLRLSSSPWFLVIVSSE